MATTKITVTLPDDQLAAIREFVAAKRSTSVSGFVQHAVAVALSDVTGWQTMLEDALAETGGPLTDAEREWADALIDPPYSAGKGNTPHNKAA